MLNDVGLLENIANMYCINLSQYEMSATLDFQQCGMCDQQRLRPACAYAQSDQRPCKSLEYSIGVKLLIEHHLEVLNLNRGCTGSSEFTLVQIPHCWKSNTRYKCIGIHSLNKHKIQKGYASSGLCMARICFI